MLAGSRADSGMFGATAASEPDAGGGTELAADDSCSAEGTSAVEALSLLSVAPAIRLRN